VGEPRRRISVEVETDFLPGESEPEDDRYVFAYTITLANTGDVGARLLTRHWVITNADGLVQEVHGEGVVGELLARHASFARQGVRAAAPHAMAEGRELDDGELVADVRRVGERDVERAAQQQRGEVARGLAVQVRLERGVLFAQAGDGGEHEDGREGPRDRDVHGAEEAARHNVVQSIVHPTHCVAHADEQLAARGVEDDAPARPLEQRPADVLLEQPDGARQRRGGEVEDLRRGRQMLGLRHRPEGGQPVPQVGDAERALHGGPSRL